MAAIFEEILKKLVRHIGTQPWQGAVVMSRAIKDMIDPVTPKPSQLVQGTTTDLVFKMELTVYMEIKKE